MRLLYILIKDQKTQVLITFNILLLLFFAYLWKDAISYLSYAILNILLPLVTCTIVIINQSVNYKIYNNINSLIRCKTNKQVFMKIIKADLIIILIYFLINILFQILIIGLFGNYDFNQMINCNIGILMWLIFATIIKYSLYFIINNYDIASFIVCTLMIVARIIEASFLQINLFANTQVLFYVLIFMIIGVINLMYSISNIVEER